MNQALANWLFAQPPHRVIDRLDDGIGKAGQTARRARHRHIRRPHRPRGLRPRPGRRIGRSLAEPLRRSIVEEARHNRQLDRRGDCLAGEDTPAGLRHLGPQPIERYAPVCRVNPLLHRLRFVEKERFHHRQRPVGRNSRPASALIGRTAASALSRKFDRAGSAVNVWDCATRRHSAAVAGDG